jgi:hypothetical protein
MRVQTHEYLFKRQRTGTVIGKPLMHVHVTGLRDKAEYAAVLLVEGPHVCSGSAIRGGNFAGERLLCDLRQIAKAILATPGQSVDSQN